MIGPGARDLVLPLLLTAAVAGPDPGLAAGSEPLAPRLGAGFPSRPLSVTASGDSLVRVFLDQGLALVFGGNPGEALRSFREASRRDSACAMAYWGTALAAGPDFHRLDGDGIPGRGVSAARAAASRAAALASRAPETERALIEALAARYPRTGGAVDDEAFAAAMRDLVRRRPDPTLSSLLAWALMNRHPADYWSWEGKPRPWTPEIEAALHSARRRDPSHPLANHLTVHLYESSRTPERGLEAALRLAASPPGTAHLVHLRAHLYLRVGEHAEATRANERAVAADLDYGRRCREQGFEPFTDLPRYRYALCLSAAMEGRSGLSLEAARVAADAAGTPAADGASGASAGTRQHFLAAPLLAAVRFGRWETILAHRERFEGLPYAQGLRHYARGMAHARTGRLTEADRELERLRDLEAGPALAKVTVLGHRATALLQIAALTLRGEVEARAWNVDPAVGALRRAIEIEDSLAVREPPDGFLPVRQLLGAVLVEAGRHGEAEAVYREDLETYPRNGWSLFGMARALRGQGKNEAARRVEQLFEKAWTRADVSLPGSRY